MMKLFSYGNRRMNQNLWHYLTVTAILISFDQWSKYHWQESSGAFTNQQGSFSMPLPPWLIIIASIVIITALSHILFKKKTSKSMLYGLTFILSGGISNLIDRLLNGYVQDIIAIASTHFNLADMYIFIGAVFFLVSVYQTESKRQISHG